MGGISACCQTTDELDKQEFETKGPTIDGLPSTKITESAVDDNLRRRLSLAINPIDVHLLSMGNVIQVASPTNQLSEANDVPKIANPKADALIDLRKQITIKLDEEHKDANFGDYGTETDSNDDDEDSFDEAEDDEEDKQKEQEKISKAFYAKK